MTCQMNHQRQCKKITQEKIHIYPILEKENPKAKMNGHAWELSFTFSSNFEACAATSQISIFCYDLQGDFVYFTESLPYLPRLSRQNRGRKLATTQRRLMSSRICAKMGKKARSRHLT